MQEDERFSERENSTQQVKDRVKKPNQSVGIPLGLSSRKKSLPSDDKEF